MTDTYFTEDDLSVETLFTNGVCMTYNPFLSKEAFFHASKLKKEYREKNNVKHVLIKTKAVLVCRGLSSKFHYFSNGILIHRFEEKEQEALQRTLTALKIRNLPIRKIYAIRQIYDYWRASNYMISITERAELHYPYKEDMEIVPFPKSEDLVCECFANGNVLLTASKYENISPNIRDYMALFADGRYYVSEEYDGTNPKYSDENIVTFIKEHREKYVILREIFVPHKYITALYKKAEEYDWYISAENAQRKNNISDAQNLQMHNYIKNLFDGRKCISVTNLEDDPITHFGAKPDADKYALFTDGLLVVGNSRSNVKNTYWYDQMCRIYKDMNLKVELVPDYYISAIYAELPKYQRSASDIYMELLKEKAQKLKQGLNISHHEALDIAAKTQGWDNFQSIKIEDEAHARNLISMARWHKKIAEGSVLQEYELYLKKQKANK